MAHFHIDLAFAANSSAIGYAAGQPTPYYPLQFALILGDDSCFTLGPNGGFADGDTFDIHVYDITAQSGGTTQPQDQDAQLQIAASTIDGQPALDVFQAHPTPESSTPISYRYGGGNGRPLSYSSESQSAAYGKAPCYSIYKDPSFTMASASPAKQGCFKLSFSFTAKDSAGVDKTYIVDPEMIYGREDG